MFYLEVVYAWFVYGVYIGAASNGTVTAEKFE